MDEHRRVVNGWQECTGGIGQLRDCEIAVNFGARRRSDEPAGDGQEEKSERHLSLPRATAAQGLLDRRP